MSDSPPGKPDGKGNGAAGGAPAEVTRLFGLRRFYIKDLSFEAPNSPGIFSEADIDPDIKVNLRTSQRNLGDGLSEVVLHVTVHAVAGQRTVFLVERQQAGAFQIGVAKINATEIGVAEIGIAEVQSCCVHVAQVAPAVVTVFQFAGIQTVALLIETLDVLSAQQLV